MLGPVEEEIAKSDEIWSSPGIAALREQMEGDFGLWGPYEYISPPEEGKWDDVTTNSPTVLANKIIGLLSSSWLQLYIDADTDIGSKDENKSDRTKVSNTEQLANGVIWLSDKRVTKVPSGKRLQSALSSRAVLRGGTVTSVYWYTKDDKPVCQIKEYDPLFCQWIEGDEELLWFCYRDYVSQHFFKTHYKGQEAKAEPNGRILRYTFWDKDEWKEAVGGNYIDGEKHGLGYVPVNVKTCGAVPYVQSTIYEDTMKWSWQSVYTNNRAIYYLESKLLSIEATKAIESGKIKIAGEWNSATSGNQPPEGLEKLGYGSQTRNEIILFDVAKGQKFGGMVQPPSNEIVDQFLSRVRGMDIIGSIDPIAFGQMTRSGSGALAAELRDAALEFINPFREIVQEDFKWIAEESVTQYKDGQFDKINVEGRNSKKEKFHIDISPADVEDSHFECELVPDRLRDELQELGAAIQSVSYGLTSRRTAMVKHNIVEDPDREQDIMDEELAGQDPVLKYDKLAKYWQDQGDDRMALYYIALSKITIENTIRQAVMESQPPEQSAVEGGVPGITPQANAANIGVQGQNMENV